MDVIIVDAEVRNAVRNLRNNFEKAAVIFEDLADILKSVTMEHGGLSSSKMRDSLEKRRDEARAFAEEIRRIKADCHAKYCSYLHDIEEIDMSLY